MSGSWYDDDGELTRELQRALAPQAQVPVVPGHDQLVELARGGQGIVYTAVQRTTGRVVAVKVVREGLTERDRRRFQRETELAATLRHPNVVALYDCGQTGDGRPFLVMELVDGPTIDCADCVLAIRSGGPDRAQVDRIVDLVARAGDGVAYAHRRGVVHRDLKPSNIRLDADGTPKVIDFGLAKDLSGAAAELTVTAGSPGACFLGSLPWASPEQAEGRSQEVDVRSDVYSLGLLLYRLLTGRFPYDVESDLRTTLQAIVEQSPLPPRRLARAIPADLETILLQCLQKDPERRYQSAGEVVADLRRYLAGAAIAARRDSTWYLLRKTAGRHRVAVALAGLALASMVVGAAVALLLWRRAEDGRRIALASQRRAEAAMDYFAGTLMAVDPDRDGKDVKVIDLLQRAAVDLQQRFLDDPDSKTFFLIKLTDLFSNLSALPDAERQAADTVAVSRAAWGDADARTLFARANLGRVLHRQGRTDEALAQLETAATAAAQAGLQGSTAAAHVFGNLGNCLLAKNRIDEAEAAFRVAAAVDPADDRTQQLRSAALENLAAIADWRGNADEAVRMLRSVVDARQRDLGPEHSATLRSVSNLAFYLSRAGQHAEAEAIMAGNLAACRRRFGANGIETLSALNNHAQYLQTLGRVQEAEQEMRACLEGRLAVLGEDHPHTLITWNNLATLEQGRGDFAAAEHSLRKVLEIRARKLGEGHADTLISGNNLGRLLQQKGDRVGAIAQLREVVDVARRELGVSHWMTALFAANLGAVLLEHGDHAAAEPLLREAVRVLEEKRGKDHPDTVGARRRLDELLRATGREAEVGGPGGAAGR